MQETFLLLMLKNRVIISSIHINFYILVILADLAKSDVFTNTLLHKAVHLHTFIFPKIPQHHSSFIRSAFCRAARGGLRHTNPAPSSGTRSRSICLLRPGFGKAVGGSAWMNLMSHSEIICELLFARESQDAQPHQNVRRLWLFGW